MNQIKCPKCGEVFSIDDATYMAIAEQVKDKEFNKRVEARVAERMNALDLKSAAEMQKLAADHQKEIAHLGAQILKLTGELDRQKTQVQLELTKANLAKEEAVETLKTKYELEIKSRDSEIEYYKNYKRSLSTKMVGESLEQYCYDKFNEVRPMAFPNAYFEKDNEVVDHSKADFIYRDYTDDGMEYVSIIFEMKHENEETKIKHKNENFFAELDKDRKNKKIEYAVLVSTLEAESDYYNAGIVDVSHRYDKMFVVRPQNFLPVISLLRNAAKATIEQKRALMIAEAKNVDVVKLEDKLSQFSDSFSKTVTQADKNHRKAIEDIDRAIEFLQKTKDELLTTQKHLNTANGKLEGLKMRKLLKDSPSLLQEYQDSQKDDQR